MQISPQGKLIDKREHSLLPGKLGGRNPCKLMHVQIIVRRVMRHLLRVLELWHDGLVVLPGAALGVAAHGLDVLLQGPEQRERGRNLDSCAVCSKKKAFKGENGFLFDEHCKLE